jgi:hypothetical protein
LNHLKAFVDQQLEDEGKGLTGPEVSISTVGWRPYIGRHVMPPDRSIVKWFEV